MQGPPARQFLIQRVYREFKQEIADEAGAQLRKMQNDPVGRTVLDPVIFNKLGVYLEQMYQAQRNYQMFFPGNPREPLTHAEQLYERSADPEAKAPAKTRKAPAKTAAAAPAKEAEAKTTTKPEGKAKRGWWNRKK